jgi:hypothetical protein
MKYYKVYFMIFVSISKFLFSDVIFIIFHFYCFYISTIDILSFLVHFKIFVTVSNNILIMFTYYYIK